jgi:aspartate-semialdehyde dehydrogenase
MRIGVLGATGLVGEAMLALLAECSWLQDEPVALASERSAGRKIGFGAGKIVCRQVAAQQLANLDIVLFSAGGEASRTWGPVAAAAGAWVVDNSAAFRQDPAVALVVPEINGDLVAPFVRGQGGGIIANPNCSTIQVAQAVAPLEREFGLRQVQVTTMQAASGAGRAAVAELQRQTAGLADDEPPTVFARVLAANVLPAIGAELPDGSFEEEAKIGRELRKILGRGGDLAVSCTAVRVPVITGHSAAVRVVCATPATREQALAVLTRWPGLVVAEGLHEYTTAREFSGQLDVHVGRVRRDPDDERALLLWVVADNLLKGAAWNAVQIAGLLAGTTDR